MHVVDISPLGWLHSAGCMIALFAGALNLAAVKGTPQHRLVGRVYVWSMVVLNLSALTIYRFDTVQFKPFKAGPHVFGFFHWFAVATLVFVLIGRYAAARQNRALWAYVHPVAMILSYYLLVGGAINEAFVRIDALHTLAARSAGSLTHAMGAPIVGLAHTAAMAAAFTLILYFVAKVALYRRAARA